MHGQLGNFSVAEDRIRLVLKKATCPSVVKRERWFNKTKAVSRPARFAFTDKMPLKLRVGAIPFSKLF